jgi:protein SCO1
MPARAMIPGLFTVAIMMTAAVSAAPPSGVDAPAAISISAPGASSQAKVESSGILAPPPQTAQTPFHQRVPPELEGIDIIEHLDAQLPLDVQLIDASGNTVRLGDAFDGVHPVILTLGYYRCPSLCNETLNGMVRALKELDWSIGGEFRIVTVSINPQETHELAAVKQEAYHGTYPRPRVKEGWRFHAAAPESSEAIARAVGFQYRLQEDGEYAHAACVFLCTPDGRVSRYLYGLEPKVGDLRLALIEAAQGKVGSAFDRFILWCHYYDPHAKGYAKNAATIARLVGAMTLVAVIAGFLVLRKLVAYDAARRRAGLVHVPYHPEGGLQT